MIPHDTASAPTSSPPSQRDRLIYLVHAYCDLLLTRRELVTLMAEAIGFTPAPQHAGRYASLRQYQAATPGTR